MCVCVCIYTHTHTDTQHTHVCVYVCVAVYGCAGACVCVCVWGVGGVREKGLVTVGEVDDAGLLTKRAGATKILVVMFTEAGCPVVLVLVEERLQLLMRHLA
jgi:hypothetical protein